MPIRWSEAHTKAFFADPAFTESNADRIKARLVVEGANYPTTPGADRILRRRGIRVLPDVVAAAGGIVAGYFEWVQNLENQDWDRRDALQKLESRIVKATERVVMERSRLVEGLERYQREWRRVQPEAPDLKPPTLRVAAYVLALTRCRAAVTQRGVWP